MIIRCYVKISIKIRKVTLESFNVALEEFCYWRNKQRRFKKLNWKTPDEWLESYTIAGIVAFLLITQQFGQGPNASESSELINFEKKKKIIEDEKEQALKKNEQKAVRSEKLVS